MPILCLSDKSYPTVPAFSENPFISTRVFCTGKVMVPNFNSISTVVQHDAAV